MALLPNRFFNPPPMEHRDLAVLAAVRDPARLARLRRQWDEIEAFAPLPAAAASWDELRASMERVPCDLCLLDAGLPGLAPEVLHSLDVPRSHRPSFVLLVEERGDTALDLDDAATWLRAGAAEVLPWTQLDRLEATCRLALARHEAARSGAAEPVINEQRFHELFEGSPEAIFVESLDGYVLDANPAACRLHGLPREQLVGRAVQDLVPPERRGENLENFARLRAGEIAYMESYSLHASGAVVPVEIRASRATFGGRSAVLLHVRDVSERKEAEHQIRHLKAFYEQVLNDLPADVAVMDPDGRIVFLNRTSVRDPELRAWLIGKTGLDYCQRRGLDPSLAERRHACIAEAVATRQVVRFEETLRNADGETRHILRMASPMIGPSGTVEQVIGYGLDITDLKRTEEALLQNEALLRTVISNIPVILFALDETGRFTLAEGKGLEALRSQPGEVVGQSIYKLYDHLPDFLRNVERALAGEALNTLVEVSGRAFECWLSPLRRADGTTSGAIGVAADVTEMQQQQAALERSQEELRDLALHLQSIREEERTRISREVHDVLGQALTALRMELAWIERALPADDTLHERITAMKQLIDATIQTVRRIASDLRPGILDDLGLAAALEWQAQQFETRTGIPCTFTDRTTMPDLDRDRATAIFRIFQEILTNAARHAAASHVDIVLAESDGMLILEVQDNGRGISPEDLESKRTLGILGMRERVLPWHGSVRLDGAPGRGTRVTVTLPLQSIPEMPVKGEG